MRRLNRIVILIIIVVILVNLALFFSLWLRFDGQIPAFYLQSYRQIIGIYTVLLIALFYLFGLYHRLWQYASIGELLSIVGAVSVGSLLFFGYSLLKMQGATYVLPRSVFVFSWLINIFLIGASRLSWRLMRDHWFFPNRFFERKPVLVVGAGDAGATVVRELKNRNDKSGVPIGFVDDDQSKQKNKMFGIPVLGKREDIPRLVDEYGVEEIIVAIPSAPGWVIRELVDICSTTPAKLKIVPGLYELIDGRVSVNQIRELQVEDLLDREPVKVDLDSMAGYLSGRTVLVTGAGGSIGSELCRQIARFKPRCLILLDHCENAIYEIHRELGEQNLECELVPVVADIRDKQAMDNLFAGLRPQVVFHAAAHKHVPLMEDNPAAALKNNVLGTWNVARAAHDGQIETFILISTDKAVNPVSIMGATKRVAEMVIQYLAQNSSTRFAAVRFGNVLGSSGSVVPLFQKQIARGGPVTVTHPEMTRFFMTIPEAVQLVIQAGALAKGGEIFVLDMGKPMKIVELARRMIKLAGFRPEQDIQIVYTGIRPGEKLCEEILTQEEGVTATWHQRIFVARPDGVDCSALERLLGALESNEPINSYEEAVELLNLVLPSFKKDSSKERLEQQEIGNNSKEVAIFKRNVNRSITV
ncbi:MAG: nucleoside-diphosphate sugar epimerase/dehydratase [Dethiobacteria bacterium]